jgi:hypothetical protein
LYRANTTVKGVSGFNRWPGFYVDNVEPDGFRVSSVAREEAKK